MHVLELLSAEAVDAALDKAHTYRLLNEPRLAESICADVLAVEPDNQRAIAMLILALTDRRGARAYRVTHHRPEALVPLLASPYERAYHAGLVAERRALAALDAQVPPDAVWAGLDEAMRHYRTAARLRPQGNDDAILRWNTCARILDANGITPPPPDEVELADCGPTAG